MTVLLSGCEHTAYFPRKGGVDQQNKLGGNLGISCMEFDRLFDTMLQAGKAELPAD